MKFERVFSQEPSTVVWNKRDCRILDSDGKVKFEQLGVEAPESWSDNAVNIVASKYFKINGHQESSVAEVIERVVTTITNWGIEQNYFTEEDSLNFVKELTFLLVNQYACFNSPIWFNFGVAGREQQAHACFLCGVEDNSLSIREWQSVESAVFKGGSGSGINLSPLRHKNAPLSTGGYASGPLSFMKAADCNAGVWKSGGATRRAATLRRLDITHPDVEDFIVCKSKEELKAFALIVAGYDSAIDGEAYSTVAFQNMNHSVGVDDGFMQRVVDKDPEAVRLMTLMATNAWNCGDPGIQYDDTINSWDTTPNSGRINTSNPCGEYLNKDWSACLLASLNLLKFRTEHEGLVGFDFDKFAHAVRIFTTALDIIIDKADYPHPKFKENSHKQRQIGLGYSNLGALLMSLGLPYGSDDGRSMAARITSTMTSEAYIQSALISRELGPFVDYTKNEKEMLNIISRHLGEANLLGGRYLDSWNTALHHGTFLGYRNSVVSLIAPTGTISFMMDCDTTGVESEVALIKYKKLVGGGTLQLVNGTVPLALRTLGYDSNQVETIINYISKNGTIEGAPEFKEEHLPVFDCSLKPANGTRFIAYQDHIKMVAVVQPFLSMGVSKTINMPNSCTIEDIYNLYVDGWKMNIKSLSVYRDGSKSIQPLNVSHQKTKEAIHSTRRPLPPERPSITHKFDIGGFEGYLHCGLYDDGTLGEIFIDASKCGSTVSGLLDGFATSISYGLQYGVPLEVLVEKFTNSRFDPAGFTKNPEIRLTTSVLDYIFQWLRLKFLDKKPQHIVYDAIVKANVQANKELFDKPQTKHTGEVCRCGSMLVRTGTCLTCPSCGDSPGACA